jgi:two-component system chemotaxis sensor kinase CheA
MGSTERPPKWIKPQLTRLVSEAPVDRILESLTEPAPEQPGTLAPQAPVATLRVDVDRIDTLVRLTGELLIAKNAIGHSAERAHGNGDPRALAVALKNQHLALDRLVGELQRSVFSLRVLPLQHAFQRFPASSGKWPPRWASRRAS